MDFDSTINFKYMAKILQITVIHLNIILNKTNLNNYGVVNPIIKK